MRNVQSIFELVHAEMKSDLNALSLDNLDAFETRMLQSIKILRSANELNKMETLEQPVIKFSESECEGDFDTHTNTPAAEGDTDLPETAFTAYATLNRKLKGGDLKFTGPDGTQVVEYINEQLLRALDFYHQDIIKIEQSDGSDSRHPYQFTLHQRGDGSSPEEINVVEKAFIKYSDLMESFVVEEYLSPTGEIKKLSINKYGNNIFKVNHKDIKSMRLASGDIVDVAWLKGFEVVKVRWKYKQDADSVVRPKKSTHYKEKKEVADEDVEQIFKGRKIALFGGTAYWLGLTEEVNKRGGELIKVQTSTDSIIEKAVKDADLVIIAVEAVSHLMSDASKKYAKEYDTPFIALDNLGRSSFVRTIDECLNQ